MVSPEDKQFLEEFESLTFTGNFNHVNHLRLCFLYLQSNGLEGGIVRTGQNIRAFAESKGAKDKYHQTITEALVRIIDLRVIQRPVSDWQTFVATNPDLVQQAKEVLLQHYTSERLFSPEARLRFLEPDRLPLEENVCTPLAN